MPNPSQPAPNRSLRPGPVREAAAIVFAGVLLGLLANTVSPRGIQLVGDYAQGAAVGSLPESERQALPETIDIDGIEAAAASDSAVVIDARAPEEYEGGHIPGALSLPTDYFEEYFPPLEKQLAASPRVIVYCDGGDCVLSHDLAMLLRERGLTRLQIFTGGWEEWMAAEKPVEEGQPEKMEAEPEAESGTGTEVEVGTASEAGNTP